MATIPSLLRAASVALYLGLMLSRGTPALGQEAPSQGPVDCDPAGRDGIVVRDSAFEWQFEPGLLFRLAPTRNAPPNPPGWTIEVRSTSRPENELVWAATPPFRFSNPRFVDTGYGLSAQQAIDWAVRDFRFALSDQQYEHLAAAVRTLMWPAGEPEASIEEALRTVETSVVGRGRLTVRDATLGSPSTGLHGGSIERLVFRIELCSPADGGQFSAGSWLAPSGSLR